MMWIDSVTAAMETPLEILKTKVKDRKLWRQHIHRVALIKNDSTALNNSMLRCWTNVRLQVQIFKDTRCCTKSICADIQIQRTQNASST